MNIYLYEVHHRNFNRYVYEIVNRLTKSNARIQIFLIKDVFINGPIKVNSNCQSQVSIITTKKLKKHAILNPPHVFICFGYRIPDLYWTYFFKSLGAKTFQVQHGLYTNFFPKSIFGYLSNFRRKLRYLYYFILIAVLSDSSIKNLASILRKDFIFRDFEAVINESLMSDHIFVWGEYWINWYKHHLFYKSAKTTFSICGSFDALLLRNKNNQICDDDSIAYICQTLVEDGRMTKKMFNAFLENLEEFASSNKIKLHIKVHPRSDLNLYKKIIAHPAIELTNKFPITRKYIGHYSALLGVCFRRDSSVLIVSFPGIGHKIPEHFSDMASSIITYRDKICLVLFFNNTKSLGRDPSFYYLDKIDPYKKIAIEIINEISV